MKIAVFRMWHQ